jgi:hypothetical protein
MAPSETLTSKRYFSVDEANRMLPLVRRIVGDVVTQAQVVSDLQIRLDAVRSLTKKTKENDPYSEETALSRTEFDAEQAKLSEYVEELVKLGIELKALDGLCDFPAMHDGREVYLCWRLGEPEVAHWHEVDAGFAGRQPIGADFHVAGSEPSHN